MPRARDKNLYVSRLNTLPKVHTNWWQIVSKIAVIGWLCFTLLVMSRSMSFEALLLQCHWTRLLPEMTRVCSFLF
jgi:hypothetical protein